MIKEIWNKISLENINKEFIEQLRVSYPERLSSNDKKYLENYIRNYNCNGKEDVAMPVC